MTRPRTRSTDLTHEAAHAHAPAAAAKPLKKRARADEDEEAEEVAEAAAAAPRAAKRGGGVPSSASSSSLSTAADEDESALAPAGATTLASFMAANKLRMSGGPTGFTCPAPITTFAAAPFAGPLLSALAKNFAGGAPTVTQAISWPIALAGHNIVSVAKTGSGKTLGFLLPIFHMLTTGAAAPAPLKYGAVAGPRVLIMAPTRELACQTEVESQKFGRALGLKTACVYGGAAKGPQIFAVRNGADVVVGTPGRLQDLHDMGCLQLGGVKFLVLDEADRMLDMGFEDAIRALIALIPSGRQSLFFTATWPRAVQRLADEFAPRSVHVASGETDVLAANASITQNVTLVSGEADKVSKLAALFQTRFMEPPAEAGAAPTVVKADHGKVIVFVKFKHAANKVAQVLWDAGFAVNTLHGDMMQNERTRVIGQFRGGELRVLVATDVAARGLDINDVTDVVNFDFPFGRNGCEDYVHRIGRTGRAGRSGTSHTFFDAREDGKNAHGLVQLLVGAKQAVPDELKALAGRGSFGGGKRDSYGGGRSGRGGRGGGRRW